MRVNLITITLPTHTRCLFLDLFGVSMPGPITIHPFLPCFFSLQYWYGNIGTATLLLSSDLSHRPHSSGTSSKSYNSWYVWLLLWVFSLFSFITLAHKHTHTPCTCKWRHSVHEEEAGGNFKSSLLFFIRFFRYASFVCIWVTTEKEAYTVVI